MKKILLLSVLLISCFFVKAQESDYYSSYNFSVGRTGTPGDLLKVGMEIGETEKLSIFADVAAEFSRHKNIKYSSYGLTAGGRYYLVGGNSLSSKINLGVGFGGTVEFDQEPILYKSKSFTQKLNYGVSGNLIFVYVYDPTIGLFASIEQKYLLNKALGNLNYNFSVGLRIHFGKE